MDATLGDDPAGIRPLPDDLVHLALGSRLFKSFTKGFSQRIGTASKPTFAITDVAVKQLISQCRALAVAAEGRPGADRPRGGARDQGSVGAAGSWVHDGHSRAEDMEVVCGNGMGEDWSGGQAAWQQRGSAGLGMGHGARATPARSLPRSSY